MSYIGIVVSSVFAMNAILAYGFGAAPSNRKAGGSGIVFAFALILVDLASSLFLWCIRAFVLAPLNLASLDIVLYVFLAIPALRALARIATAARSPRIAMIGKASNDIMLSSIAFGIALVSTRSGYGLLEALAASVGSGLGYWMATYLLEAVRERLDASDLPRPFKGPPAMLISAGLMAMAFMGIDSIFVKNLAG